MVKFELNALKNAVQITVGTHVSIGFIAFGPPLKLQIWSPEIIPQFSIEEMRDIMKKMEEITFFKDLPPLCKKCHGTALYPQQVETPDGLKELCLEEIHKIQPLFI